MSASIASLSDLEPLVLVGSRAGLFLLEPDAGWACRGPLLPGLDVSHAVRDRRDGTLWAAANDAGGHARVCRSDDGGATWDGGALPGERAWHVREGRNGEVYAGVKPAGLLRSDDRGRSWQPVLGLNDHPTRGEWWEGGAGLVLHTILLPPGRNGRIYAGISVAGLFRSDDGGATWCEARAGLPAGEHNVLRDAMAASGGAGVEPTVVFGTTAGTLYASRDGGERWEAVASGLGRIQSVEAG